MNLQGGRRSVVTSMKTLSPAAIFSVRKNRVKRQEYQQLPESDNGRTEREPRDDAGGDSDDELHRNLRRFQSHEKKKTFTVILIVVGLVAFLYMAIAYVPST